MCVCACVKLAKHSSLVVSNPYNSTLKQVGAQPQHCRHVEIGEAHMFWRLGMVTTCDRLHRNYIISPRTVITHELEYQREITNLHKHYV